MRILHTADWHVGKVLKGRARLDEHAAVLAELVELARTEDVDLTLIAGDVFDTAAPIPEAQAIVMRTLLALREDGRDVVVLAGNHDNPHLLDVYRPVLGTLGVHVIGTFRTAANGGAPAFTARSGEPVRVAALPFLSQRFAVRALEALLHSPEQHARAYADRIRELLADLTSGFVPGAVNLAVTHGTLPAGRLGGGEREAQSVVPYWFEPDVFPPATTFAALGHLHRRQRLAGPCPIWYAGSPLAVDFGDEELAPGALVVDAEPGGVAAVREHTFTSPRRLRTVRGSLDELAALAGEVGDAWLRAVVAEHPRPGLAEAVRQVLPGVLEVDVDERFRPTGTRRRDAISRMRTPRRLLADYLDTVGRHDPRLMALFDRLHDEATAGGG